MLRFDDSKQTERIRLGATATLSIEGIGTCTVRTIMPSDETLHVQFDEISAEQAQMVDELLRTSHQRDLDFGEMCKQGAREIAQVMSDGIRNGSISQADLFSEVYTPIDGTDPQQFNVAYASFTDRAITSIQDRIQAADPDIVIACSIDRNAMIATHNSNYSQPQRPNDPVWNAGNSRNRRFFTDKAGMLSAHNKQEVLTQTYARDMGGGVMVYLKEVDSPIIVDGTFWGNLRLGYKI
jgi:methyl-accepting chemotaxis protein